MPTAGPTLPPEVRRLSGLYKIIEPGRFAELGIEAEDVPMGTYPAEDHPPYLPDRCKGNAYGLGFFEQNALSDADAGFLESIDLDDPEQVRANARRINAIFKRLGLLIRYSNQGRPYYLIPRRFVAHFLVEVQAKVDEIVSFLRGLFSRRLRESLRVGVVTTDSDLIMPELQARLPQAEFRFIDTLTGLARQRQRFDALVLLGDPQNFAEQQLQQPAGDPAQARQFGESLGLFVAGRLYDLLEDDGELMVICDRPVSSSRDTVRVRFKREQDRKRFLLFTHVFRSRRRYYSDEGPDMEINRFDFHSFLSGLGFYHESVESLLQGRRLDQVAAEEIDRLPHQDIPMPRGSTPQMLGAWRRWFGPFFFPHFLGTALAEVQRTNWLELYGLEGEPPDNLVIYQGRRRPPKVTLASLEGSLKRQHLAGCDRELLAPYKDSFDYVLRVLGMLEQVQQGDYAGLPGPELARLRGPFETSVKYRQTKDVLELIAMAPRLRRLRQALNPAGLLGPRTSVLGNIDKLSLLGIEENLLVQLYLIVLGHSTMSRVTFGKLSETTLAPLSDIGRYQNLQEAVAALRLYRLMSVAETAAASSRPLTSEHLTEFFTLMNHAVQIASRPELGWEQVLDEEMSRLGGVQAKATRKMLKLLGLYDYLGSWPAIAAAGPHEHEARARFDPRRLADIKRVVELVRQVERFVGHYYADESSSRPYFFRALLASELHGTGRLLHRIGPTATFTLLWICVHVSERRLIDFNPLLQTEHRRDRPRRLRMLRRALETLTPQQLSPGWLLRLREAVETKGEAYVRDSGLHLFLDPETKALAAGFVDPDEELDRLEAEIDEAVRLQLPQVAARVLSSMDRRAYDVGRFLAAWRKSRGLRPASRERRRGFQQRLDRLEKRLEQYLLGQLAQPRHFAPNLWRMVRYCPQRLNRWLPDPVDSRLTQRRLKAAGKLGALFEKRLDYFQDMQLSHEAARVEFGPNTAGVVGVSPRQFSALTADLERLADLPRGLGWLMSLAVLLYHDGVPAHGRPAIPERLLRRLQLTPAQQDDLEFLLQNHQGFFRIISGRCCLGGLDVMLDRRDPELIEALFLLGLVTTAARREGLLTEDLLNRFQDLMAIQRRLAAAEVSASQAQREEIQRQASLALAFTKYRGAQDAGGSTVSLRRLLDHTTLPTEDQPRQRLLAEGRLQAGVGRLLKLRGLFFVTALDLLMVRRGIPVPFIHSLKGLRSMGATHFERDLYEGLRLYRGLQKLPQPRQDFLLGALADPEHPVMLMGFGRAAERLTYTNQSRLLLLGLAGAHHARGRGAVAAVVNFAPLAGAAEARFEMVNQALSRLDPQELVAGGEGIQRLLAADQGLGLSLEAGGRVLSVRIGDPPLLEKKIRDLRMSEDPLKLKHLYHRELKRLKLTAYDTLDYQQRLEAAFNQSIERLGRAMVERVRRQMSREEDLQRLEALYQEAYEEGLALPLSDDGMQTLDDLYEMNIDRLRAALAAEVRRELAAAGDPDELEELWDQVRGRLKQHHRFFGRAFELSLARRFDARARELADGSPD